MDIKSFKTPPVRYKILLLMNLSHLQCNLRFETAFEPKLRLRPLVNINLREKTQISEKKLRFETFCESGPRSQYLALFINRKYFGMYDFKYMLKNFFAIARTVIDF